MIIGTAGHIDHGKTALVKALTGIDADRLQEEKARGITIDLGFAYQPLEGGEILGFIDVPGHEKFIHNMLAGATGIDYVLLTVAADDGPMPQTHEHLAIVDLLNLSRGAVALTKIDVVDTARVAEVTGQIRALLTSTALADAPIFPVSALTGDGIVALARELAQAAASSVHRHSSGHFRLAVDRCFTLAGIGVVVTGTVFAGEVALGDKLVVSPAGLRVRVRGIHAQNRIAGGGQKGQRCALNLAGPQLKKSDVKRGDWIVAEAIHAPVSRLDARLKVLASEPKALRHWTPLHVHIGALDVNGRVAVLEADAVGPGDSALVQLVLEHPIGALRGDRFVIRDQSAQRTMGGGVVLDPFAPERGRRKSQRAAILRALERDAPDDSLCELVAMSPHGLDLGQFALRWNLTKVELDDLSNRSTAKRVMLGDRTFAFAPERWREFLEQVESSLASSLRGAPDSRGITAEALRRSLPEKIPVAILNAVIADLLADRRLLRAGPLLRLPGHQVSLSAHDAKLAERVITLLEESGLKPPKFTELASQLGVDGQQLRQLLKRLAQDGKIHAVSADYYFAPSVIDRLVAATARIANNSAGQTFTVAQFRSETGIGRNLAIPLLEFFDRTGFTLRVGEGRKVRMQGTGTRAQQSQAVKPDR